MLGYFHINIYIYICMYISTCVCMYVYIYIHMCMYGCTCISICMCIYIYMYIHISSNVGHDLCHAMKWGMVKRTLATRWRFFFELNCFVTLTHERFPGHKISSASLFGRRLKILERRPKMTANCLKKGWSPLEKCQEFYPHTYVCCLRPHVFAGQKPDKSPFNQTQCYKSI